MLGLSEQPFLTVYGSAGVNRDYGGESRQGPCRCGRSCVEKAWCTIMSKRPFWVLDQRLGFSLNERQKGGNFE